MPLIYINYVTTSISKSVALNLNQLKCCGFKIVGCFFPNTFEGVLELYTIFMYYKIITTPILKGKHMKKGLIFYIYLFAPINVQREPGNWHGVIIMCWHGFSKHFLYFIIRFFVLFFMFFWVILNKYSCVFYAHSKYCI